MAALGTVDSSIKQPQTDASAPNRPGGGIGRFRSRLRPIVTQVQESTISTASRGMAVLSRVELRERASRQLQCILELSPLSSSFGGLEEGHFPSFPRSFSPNYPDDTASSASSEQSEEIPKVLSCSDPTIPSPEHTPGLAEDQQSPLYLRTPWLDDSRIAVKRPSSTALNRPPTPFPFAKVLATRKKIED